MKSVDYRNKEIEKFDFSTVLDYLKEGDMFSLLSWKNENKYIKLVDGKIIVFIGIIGIQKYNPTQKDILSSEWIERFDYEFEL